MFAKETVTTLVRFALESGSKPRLHPNGFIQLDLISNGNVHLHVWPDEELQVEKQRTKHPIHDHCFEMESLVVLGRITNFTYQATLRGQSVVTTGQNVYQMYCAHSLGNSETVLRPVENEPPCNVYSIGENVVQMGQTYFMPAMLLHDTCATGLTATLMTKARTYPNYRAKIAVPWGITPDNGFRRNGADEKVLLHFIEKALQTTHGTQGGCTHDENVEGSCCYSNGRLANRWREQRFGH